MVFIFLFKIRLFRSAPGTLVTPQRQLSTGSQQTLNPQKFVIVKPGNINIQQQIKPNIVVMNPPGTTTQVSFNITEKSSIKLEKKKQNVCVFYFNRKIFRIPDNNAKFC